MEEPLKIGLLRVLLIKWRMIQQLSHFPNHRIKSKILSVLIQGGEKRQSRQGDGR
jgi:hypothetical protein